jgi:hypothetical protein
MVAYVGIDNGVTGSIGVVYPDNTYVMYKTPVVSEQSYTKKQAKITRIDFGMLMTVLKDILMNADHVRVVIERPFVNPKGFKATVSAMRALEATLIAIEMLGIPHSYCDSRDWQRSLLPSGVKGTADLKKASLDIGKRLFPDCEEVIVKHKDADGLLIAEWARRSNL